LGPLTGAGTYERIFYKSKLQRANQLKQQGYTPETSQELAGIIKLFNNFQAQQAQSISLLFQYI
jgi:hypothetical protein